MSENRSDQADTSDCTGADGSIEPKDLEAVPSETLIRPQVSQNASFKSLPGLSAKDSLENIQKMHKFCEHPRKKLLRSYIKSSAAEKRQKRKLCQKRFEKPNFSEMNLRKFRYHFTKDKKSFNFYDSENFTKKVKHRLKDSSVTGVSDTSFLNKKKISSNNDKEDIESTSSKELFIDEEHCSTEILQPMEQLNLNSLNEPGPSAPKNFDNNNEDTSTGQVYLCSSDVFEDPKEAGDYGNGDADNEKDYCFPFGDEACARILARRSVQWNNEVDVIYYAGDTNGGRIIRREREPLREEAEQQARHNRFVQLAMNKNLLSDINSQQLHDKWFKVLK